MIGMTAPYSRCKNAVNYKTLCGNAVEAPWGRDNNAIASQRTPWERRASYKHNHSIHTAPLLRCHGVPTAFIQRCWETLRRCYGDRTEFPRTLSRLPKDGVCFVHDRNKRRTSEFCSVLCELTATPQRCLRSYWVVTATPQHFYNYKNAVGAPP